MALSNRTIIIPLGDNADSVLRDHNAIKMIIIKDDPQIVQRADDRTINRTVCERKVIWFPNGLPEQYATEFSIDTTTTIAFFLARNNAVTDVFRTTDDEPIDNIRIAEAFNNAI